ncbi:hypothetical protein [Nocardia sp. NPDC048505]|uniref:DUF7373 family lipoprotein n=1 Tax=unclassified Nocardia TaxID=2637762 RepID=UPI0033C5523E
MRRCRVLWTVVVVALLTGCTVAGEARPQRVDPNSLGVGAYSVVPLEVPAGSEEYGRTMEAARLTEALIDPVEADPAFNRAPTSSGMAALPSPARVTTVLAHPVREVLERHGMVVAASVSGTDRVEESRRPEVGRSRLLTVVVTRFADAPAAERAAREMDAVDAAVSPDNVAIAIPGHAAALAHWRPNVPTLAATLATGSYVMSLLVGHTAPDPVVLTEVAAKAFTAQAARLRDFRPTPPEQFAAMPLDPQGMLRMMVPQAPSRWPFPAITSYTLRMNAGWDGTLQPSGLVFGPRGAYLYLDRTKPLEAEAMAFNGFNPLFRMRDPVAARRAFDRAVRKDGEEGLRPVPGPAGLDDVRCVESPDPDTLGVLRYVCRVVYGRYFTTLFARELTNAQHKAAAQYGLLMNGA